MRTVDTHTHLLNPEVRFDRLFDRVTVRFFAKSLGTTPARLAADPYGTYVKTMMRCVRESHYLDRVCLFPVDARVDARGREQHRDKTVCSRTEDVLAVHRDYPQLTVPFLSVNPLRPDALDRLDAYHARGCRGAKFLQNYWRLDLNQDRLVPYYEKLRDLGIPLVIHLGSEYTIDADPAYEGIDMLRLPLQVGGTVIAAHMALGRICHRVLVWRNLSRKPRDFDADYFALLDLLERHDNLYADLAAILSPLRARALRHLSRQDRIGAKILFATDYPVPFPTLFNSFDLPWRTRRRLARITNPFDRAVEILLRYFPSSHPLYGNHQRVLDLPA